MLRLFRTAGRNRRSCSPGSFSLPSDVSVKVSDDGAVFLHSGRGVVLSCNSVGARIWRGLRDGRGVDQIAADLAAEYAVPAEVTAADTARFVAELETAGLLSRSGA